MGVDINSLNYLALHRSKYGPFGRTLQVGRQNLNIPEVHYGWADRILESYDLPPFFKYFKANDPYSDALFKYFGSTTIDYMDASDFEGATIIHDLNEKLEFLDENLQFDTVFDGGTIEHIFNIPAGFHNLMVLTKVGGFLISINAANNMLGHGLYQFSPDLVHRVFSADNGFSALFVGLCSCDGRMDLVEAVDPSAAGARVEIGETRCGTYIMFTAQRVSGVTPFRTWPQQTDYQLAWNHSKAKHAE